MSANPERLRALFSRPELQRLVKRLNERRELGRSLTGTITLESALPEERRAVDQLLRRVTTKGASLGIPLDTLLGELRKAQLADSWAEVLDALCGPPDPRRAASAAKSKAWGEVWDRALAMSSNASPMVLVWLEGLRRDGLLKRLSGDEAQSAAVWIRQAIDLFRQLPLDGEPLAAIAARLTGNSHGLDSDTPLATIILRGIALLYGCSMPTCAAERRGLWSKGGIICDELSAPVLTFNLLLRGARPLTELLTVGCAAAVPLHLSTRLLQATDWNSVVAPTRVYVCENPSLVAVALRHLGALSSPLICLDGEPKTAGWFLLEKLRNAGTELWYHGDFDWKGVAIAGRIINRVGAKPWRYSANDYLAAKGFEPLEGSPVPTPWCPNLATALDERQIVIHEEAVAESLMTDLRLPANEQQEGDSPLSGNLTGVP
jgi:uncharacterized protein (TIGR02679 family)